MLKWYQTFVESPYNRFYRRYSINYYPGNYRIISRHYYQIHNMDSAKIKGPLQPSYIHSSTYPMLLPPARRWTQSTSILRRLSILSMPFTLYYAIMNFITNRNFIYEYDGMPSSFSTVTQTGVPQGSHIGPILFILFSADIVLCTQGSTNQQLQYADDTNFFAKISCLADQLLLQKSIDNFINGQSTTKQSSTTPKQCMCHIIKKIRHHLNRNTIYTGE